MDSVNEDHEVSAPPGVDQCGALSRLLQDAHAVERFGTQLPGNDPPDRIIAAVIVAKADNQRLHNTRRFQSAVNK